MMYYKMINDRQVFSTCKTIQTNEGIWISNPSAEQIAAAGWLEYIPPVVPEQPKTEPELSDIISAIKNILSTDTAELSDEEALEVAALFPTWSSKLGKQVLTNERLWYNDKLYKVIQGHTVQSDWTPDVAVGLFTEVSIVEWPDWIQPTGVQDAYMIGDKVTYNGNHYVSLIDNNTWSPDDYPQGWEEQ